MCKLENVQICKCLYSGFHYLALIDSISRNTDCRLQTADWRLATAVCPLPTSSLRDLNISKPFRLFGNDFVNAVGNSLNTGY